MIWLDKEVESETGNEGPRPSRLESADLERKEGEREGRKEREKEGRKERRKEGEKWGTGKRMMRRRLSLLLSPLNIHQLREQTKEGQAVTRVEHRVGYFKDTHSAQQLGGTVSDISSPDPIKHTYSPTVAASVQQGQ